MSENRPPSLGYWEMVRQLAEPFELMKFTLIYDGPLPAGKNKRTTRHKFATNCILRCAIFGTIILSSGSWRELLAPFQTLARGI